MKKPGSVLMMAGMLLAAAALCLALKNRLEAMKAGREAETILSALADAMQTGSETHSDDAPVMAAEEINGIRYIGIIEIPSLGVTLPVAENYKYEQLTLSPCRYSGSYYSDDLIICAHNYPEHFGNIKYVDPGETIRFVTVEGKQYTYSVLEQETIMPWEVSRMLDRTAQWDLTLFTCNYSGESRCALRCMRAGI